MAIDPNELADFRNRKTDLRDKYQDRRLVQEVDHLIATEAVEVEEGGKMDVVKGNLQIAGTLTIDELEPFVNRLKQAVAEKLKADAAFIQAAKGLQGGKGEKGDKGAVGAKGEPGEKGQQGDPGPKGDPGNPGREGRHIVERVVVGGGRRK